jgi:hypothetical protein
MDKESSLVDTIKWYRYIISELELKSVCHDDYYYLELECDKKGKSCIFKNEEVNVKCKTFNRYQLVTFSIEADIQVRDSRHRNIIIIDNDNKTYERFEPNGSMPYDDVVNDLLDTNFRKLFKLTDYQFIKPSEFCPRFGPQKKLKGTLLIGSCIIWTLWFTEQRLKYPNKTRNDIIDEIIGKSDEYALKLIEKYINKLNDLDIIVNKSLQKDKMHQHIRSQKISSSQDLSRPTSATSNKDVTQQGTSVKSTNSTPVLPRKLKKKSKLSKSTSLLSGAGGGWVNKEIIKLHNILNTERNT